MRALTRAPPNPVEVAGIRFPGRVGLAAGMDKDGRAALAWQHLGFAFAELGTVTAQAQPGNPKPRVFRLKDSRAIINRMGFNNDGALALANRLAVGGHVIAATGRPASRWASRIGKTKVVPVEDAVADYLACFDAVHPHADYIAVNVSSPNTPGLRTLQDGGALAEAARRPHRASPRAGAGAGPCRSSSRSPPTSPGRSSTRCWPPPPTRAWRASSPPTRRCRRDGLAPADSAPGRRRPAGCPGVPLTARAREVVGYVAGHTDLPVIGRRAAS